MMSDYVIHGRRDDIFEMISQDFHTDEGDLTYFEIIRGVTQEDPNDIEVDICEHCTEGVIEVHRAEDWKNVLFIQVHERAVGIVVPNDESNEPPMHTQN